VLPISNNTLNVSRADLGIPLDWNFVAAGREARHRADPCKTGLIGAARRATWDPTTRSTFRGPVWASRWIGTSWRRGESLAIGQSPAKPDSSGGSLCYRNPTTRSTVHEPVWTTIPCARIGSGCAERIAVRLVAPAGLGLCEVWFRGSPCYRNKSNTLAGSRAGSGGCNPTHCRKAQPLCGCETYGLCGAPSAGFRRVRYWDGGGNGGDGVVVA
jgi:hypothetical protein